MLQEGSQVRIKPWETILNTVVPCGNNYRHKESGLLIIPSEFLRDYQLNPFRILEKDEDDNTYCLVGGLNYYHEDWLEEI